MTFTPDDNDTRSEGLFDQHYQYIMSVKVTAVVLGVIAIAIYVGFIYMVGNSTGI